MSKKSSGPKLFNWGYALHAAEKAIFPAFNAKTLPWGQKKVLVSYSYCPV